MVEAEPGTMPTNTRAAVPVADGRPAGDGVVRSRFGRQRAPLARHSGKGRPVTEHHHRSIQGGGARAAVFGVSDGLVTNVSLILGLAGANPGTGIVRLAGLAGLIGGSFSMSAGEYISMRAQRELLERELAVERHEIRHRPEGERRELVRIYENRGVDSDTAAELATQMMRTPELALETHAREELGINPEALGAPIQAAVSSFATFALGALVPLLPWFFAGGTTATLASVAAGGFSALCVGVGLSFFTGRTWWWSALRQLVISSCAAAVTWSIGRAVGVKGL